MQTNKSETGGGEGVEVIENIHFDNDPLVDDRLKSGQYTKKIYHLKSKIPSSLRICLPKGSLVVQEEAWDSYPFCRTVVTNPSYMKNNFLMLIESFHALGWGLENVHSLSPEKLLMREVVEIDLAKDPFTAGDEPFDPKKLKSTKTKIKPFADNWREHFNPIMTCYKLVTIEFKWLGLQNRIERLLHKTERRLFTSFHRRLVCTVDEWVDFSLKNMRDLEKQNQEELVSLRENPNIRGELNPD